MRKKNTSDRRRLKSKYTNEKKRKDRKIKIKKDMKKNPNKYHKKKSDPGVPNSAPFKLALLEEREQYLNQKEEEKQRKRAKVLQARQAMRESKVTAVKRKLTEVLNLENEKTNYSDNDSDNGDDSDDNDVDTPVRYPSEEMKLKTNNPSKKRKLDQEDGEADEAMDMDDEEKQKVLTARATAKLLAQKARNNERIFKNKLYQSKNRPLRADPDARFQNWSDKVFYRQVKQVVEAADVLLEVIDARDPLGTRCTVLESIVRARPGKKLVFVLNKADLVPKSNLMAWLTYLRAEAPTVAFKAAIQSRRKFKTAIDRMVHIGEESLRTHTSMGSDVLVQLLKNYARSFHGSGIVVGVVGLPNVGKSSLINSLKKIKTCEVGPMPGCTKNIKEIKLDAKLRLLDCPGVVLPGEEMNPVDAVLRNLVKLETVRNAEEVALEIFRRSDSLKLAMFYEVRKVEDGEEFLGLLARRYKKIVKNGVADREAAAKKLIYDWNHGILKYYTDPPTRDESSVTTSVVSKLRPEFDLDTLTTNKEEIFLSYLDDGRPSTTIKMAASDPVHSCFGFDDAENKVAENVGAQSDMEEGSGDKEDAASDEEEAVEEDEANDEEAAEEEAAVDSDENLDSNDEVDSDEEDVDE